MNAISNAVKDIKFSIPRGVLDTTFMQDMRLNGELTSLDNRIENLVIKQRVLIDANLVGGIQIVIPMKDVVIKHQEPRYTIIKIPDMVTKHRTIVSALSIVDSVGMTVHNATDSSIMSGVNMLDSVSTSTGGYQTARLQLIGDNTILIEDYQYLTSDAFLRVIVENDENMANVPPRAYPAFSHLCILAAKAYIYNQLVLEIDKGYIYRGHEFSALQNVVSGYADANTDYFEYLTIKWEKISRMMSNMYMHRHVKAMFGHNI